MASPVAETLDLEVEGSLPGGLDRSGIVRGAMWRRLASAFGGLCGVWLLGESCLAASRPLAGGRRLLPGAAARTLLQGGDAAVAPPGGVWWKTQAMYQVYPRSFQDSNGDGTGDLKGIEQRLPYLKELGVGIIWLSPVMRSPMRDFGYDISDFKDIDPIFGTLDDMRDLIQAAKQLGIQILMDFVPNHSSNESAWFAESRSSKTNPKRDWYVWNPGKIGPDGKRVPPNNWASNFGGPLGSSWTWDEQTQEYYYHAFGEFQPDLNYHNPEVIAAMQDVLRFWLDMGVGGFRIDAVPFLLEDPELRDEPVNETCAQTAPLWNCMTHDRTQNDPQNHQIIRGWRQTVDEFQDRAIFGEIYAPLADLMTYYGTEAAPEFNVPFNFQVMGQEYGNPNDLRKPGIVRDAIRSYSAAKPAWGQGNWVLGNHDNHRLMNRVGNKTVLTATIYALLNLVPGTPTIYYGDEIAMSDLWIPYDKCQDPMCIKNPKTFSASGRDPERTPMQWTAGPQAGFSTNPKTWLPVNPNQDVVNVEAERTQDGSPFATMVRTLAFRALQPELALGAITYVAGDLSAYLADRLVAVQFSMGDSFALTVANWDDSTYISFDLVSLLPPDSRPSAPTIWELLFCTAPAGGRQPLLSGTELQLPASAVAVVRPVPLAA